MAMKHLLATATGVLLLGLATPLVAQETVGKPPPNPAGWTAPRTAWGDPDLRGTYPLDAVGRTPMQRRPQYGDRLVMTDAEYDEAVRAAAEVEAGADREDAGNRLGAGNWFEYGTALRQTALIVEPAETGRIPALTEEGKRLQGGMRSSWNGEVFEDLDDFNPLDRCITRGMPATMLPFPYNNGVRVFQSPGWVVINHEMIHEQRFIPLDGRPQLDRAISTWLGSSRGHFEGDTLVVETTHFNGLAPMVIVGPSNGTAGIPTSPSMRIVEHFTPGPEGLYYEAWVEDPVVLTGPFKIAYPWARNDAYEPFEYACHEGNTLVIANIRSTSPRYAQWRADNERELAEAGGTTERSGS
ncbi:MAG TPA: hypothetical protein VEB68_08390 [Croceibacterium sp.]|nr:hypothetical protein [Croceibacterium sp.]